MAEIKDGDFFFSLTLADIYGQYTVKPGTRIVTDIPYESSLRWHNVTDAELEEIAKRYGIPSIASLSHESDWRQGEDGKFGNQIKNPQLVVSAGMGAPLTAWSPFVNERGAILAFADSLKQTDISHILEVGCGNGFVSKLLAADGHARVTGIDPEFSAYDQFPLTSGDVTLRETDIFDVIDEFGPRRSHSDQTRIKQILEKIRASFAGKEDRYFWGIQHGLRMRYEDFSEEVEVLQELAAKEEHPSLVDIVLCSFMSTGTDLTLAIRDGIRPKAIVYVKPMNELAGVGDFYAETYTNDSRDANEVVSFNPGKSYRTVTRWRTFWYDEWGREAYGQVLGVEPAEVVVQLRKDIEYLRPKMTDVVVRAYDWDMKIAEIIKKHQEKEYSRQDLPFFQGLNYLALQAG